MTIRKTLIFAAALLALSSCKETEDQKKISVGFLLKTKGNPYFLTCEKGARAAAAELDIDLRVDGPINADPRKQNEIVENWIAEGLDVIVAACENRDSISTALRKAQEAGIKVVTYDTDSRRDARTFFANPATAHGIGEKLIDTAAELMNREGEFAIITSSLSSTNLNLWTEAIKERQKDKFPGMKLVDVRPCDDQKDKAQQETTNLLSTHPNLKAIIAVCSSAVPGAAEAVKQAGKTGAVKVVGLGLPSENRTYLKDGVTQAIVLWSPEDLGYLAVHAGTALAKGNLRMGAEKFSAGKLVDLQVVGDSVILGEPVVFTKKNIDDFDF